MKKIAYLILVLLSTTFLYSGKLRAQADDNFRVVEFGIRYMPTFSSLDLKNYNGDVVVGTANMQQGFGVMLGMNVSPHVGFQGEINYNQVSQSYKDVNLDRVVKIRYLNIPLLLSLNTNKAAPVNLNIVVGPQFGINVGSKMTESGNGNTTNLQAVVAVKKGDVGLAYGAGLEFALNPDHTCRLDVGYRGFYGLVDMNANSVGSDSYNVIVKASRKSNGAYIGLAFLF
jgi:outer membrane autotransporter protein